MSREWEGDLLENGPQLSEGRVADLRNAALDGCGETHTHDDVADL